MQSVSDYFYEHQSYEAQNLIDKRFPPVVYAYL